MTRNSDWQLDEIRKILQGAKGTPSNPLSITTSDGAEGYYAALTVRELL